jgi:hypothetical protein
MGAGRRRSPSTRPARRRTTPTGRLLWTRGRAGRRCEVFFDPFRASERGSNENANRIVHRFVPKGADISKFTRAQIRRIED